MATLLGMSAEDSSRPGVLTLTAPAAAQVVLNPEQRRFLEPFLGRELGAAQAARELGESVERLAYRVRALERRGLLEVVGSRARKGRPVTLYTAPREIRAPLELLPYEDVRGFFHLVDSGLREVFLSSLARLADRAGLQDWVVRLYRSEDDGVRLDLAPSGGSWDPQALLAAEAPAVAFNWVPLTLTPQEAKELQHELMALVGRYHRSSGAPDHLLGLFLTPIRSA